MISTIQKKFSGALSSFTSTKEPKLLQRPSIETSSQPDDQAISPQQAHMPPKRSGSPSSRNTKRPKGGKARQFLDTEFNIEEESDPIESSSPPVPCVRRIKPQANLRAGKKQERSPGLTWYDETQHSTHHKMTDVGRYHSFREEASKAGVTHKHLLVDDDDERVLTYVNRPEKPDAVYITIPGSGESIRNSRSTMKARGGLRVVNTLDTAKQTQGQIQSKQNSETPRRALACFGPEIPKDHSTRNTVGEPPSKRQRTDHAPKSNIRDECVGIVSPSTRPLEDQLMTVIRAQPSIPQDARPSSTKKTTPRTPIKLDDHGAVENFMRPAWSSSKPSQSTNLSSPKTLTNGLPEVLEESDPEDFTRNSKKARHSEGNCRHPGNSTEANQTRHAPAMDRTSKDKHSAIDAIFFPTDSLDQVKVHLDGSPETSNIAMPAVPPLLPPKDTAKLASATNFDSNQASQKRSQRHTGDLTSTRKGQMAASLNGQDSHFKKFPLRVLLYGFFTKDLSRSVAIRGTTLEVWQPEPLLGREPLWTLSLTKVIKITIGTEGCSKLILRFSAIQGQPSNCMLLEFQSEGERADFTAQVTQVCLNPPVEIKYNKDTLPRIFENQHRILLESQQKKSHDTTRGQPIREDRKVPDTISPHFPSLQQNSATTVSKHQKLTELMQASSSVRKNSGADSRSPTIVTRRDRANHSSPPLPAETISRVKKEHTDQQNGPVSPGRLRALSSRTSAAIPKLRSDQSVDQVDDEKMPRKKYSQEHGLGEPWKTPLVYPKTGRRRETVEHDDLFRLDEDEFLNDNLVGFFLRYLEHHLEQTSPDLAKRVYFYNSYFFERLMQTSKGKKGINYESVQKWTRNIDIFSRDFVVVPVNESLHWYVVIICNLSRLNIVERDGEDIVGNAEAVSEGSAIASNEEAADTGRAPTAETVHDKPTQQTTESLSHLSLSEHDQQADELSPSTKPFQTPRPKSSPRKSGPGRRKSARHALPKYDVGAPVIMTLDSLGLPRSSTCTALRQYIVEEAKNKRDWDIDGSLIKGMTARGIPTQANFSDCGLYLCAYMEKFVLDPAGFVGKILQRQMDSDIDMPMMSSEDLRGRMRGMIRGLHDEQEGGESAFPDPKIGSILLAPPKAVLSEGDVVTVHSELQDDSEDELQQDQTSLPALKPKHTGSGSGSTVDLPARAATAKEPAASPAQPRRPSTLSDTTAAMDVILATVDGITYSPFQPNSGTKEAAITIDDDDDDNENPAPSSVPVSVPVSTPKKKQAVSPNDFFSHASELRSSRSRPDSSSMTRRPDSGSMTILNASSYGGAIPKSKTKNSAPDLKASGVGHSRSRAQSHDSADSVDTQFLQSGESYDVDSERDLERGRDGRDGEEGVGVSALKVDGGEKMGEKGKEEKKKKKKKNKEVKGERGSVIVVPDSQDEGEDHDLVEREGEREGEEEREGVRDVGVEVDGDGGADGEAEAGGGAGARAMIHVYEDPDLDLEREHEREWDQDRDRDRDHRGHADSDGDNPQDILAGV